MCINSHSTPMRKILKLAVKCTTSSGAKIYMAVLHLYDLWLVRISMKNIVNKLSMVNELLISKTSWSAMF